jgi:hypothetical protein
MENLKKGLKDATSQLQVEVDQVGVSAVNMTPISNSYLPSRS